jgi:homoserine kinase type II
MIRARDQGLDFVPALLPTANGDTLVWDHGRLWELTEWLPGRADFHSQPTIARLEAACIALAQLHVCWEPGYSQGVSVCPAVVRRLDRLREWRALQGSGWWPEARLPVAERAWRVLPEWAQRTYAELQCWLGASWELQPCLCDLWHDHLLFDGDRLTGLVDYGAVKSDHPAIDLARLLGSLVEDNAEMWRIGLAAYRTVRRLSAEEEQLARVLDRTGTVVGVTNWLRWLFHERRVFDDPGSALRRLEILVRRMEKWDL